jgi:hypothetical protein
VALAKDHMRRGTVTGEKKGHESAGRTNDVTFLPHDYDDVVWEVGLYPIVTFQYSSTTLYQVSYHIQYLFF